MRDDADEASAALQGGQRLHGAVERLWVETSKAFVDEDGLDVPTACHALDDIAESERQCECCLKAFAAR